MTLRDLQFKAFDFHIAPNGDFPLVDDIESFRGLVYRWLLTQPAIPSPELGDEEIETRRAYQDPEQRSLAYDPPDAHGLLACLPWDPAWGAGIKRFLNRPVTPQTLQELETRIRAGLALLQGVTRVESLSLSAANDHVTVQWSVKTTLGTVADTTLISQDAPRP